MKTGPRIFWTIILGILLLLAGCTPTPAPSGPPTLTVTSPINGVTLPTGSITANISVTNFNIVDKQGQKAVAGQGHVHYYLDVDAPATPGQPAIPASGIWAHVAATSYAFTNVAAGTHKISVELVNNDHTPLNPPVVKTITITVTSPNAPQLKIISPSGTINGIGDVSVSVEVASFSITNKLGQPSVSGEGHIHYFLDVDPPTTPGQPAVTAPGTYAATTDITYTWHNVEPGLHKLSAELVNNDHTPLMPPVVATVQVNVVAQAGKPGLIIVSPANTSTIPAGAVTVTVQLVNFQLSDKIGGANVNGQGHLNYYLDVGAPTSPGKPATTGTGIYASVLATSYTWPGITAGSHTFAVQLVNNDDTPLSPPAVTFVTVPVK